MQSMKTSSSSFLKLQPTAPSFNNKYEGPVERSHATQTKRTIPALTRFASEGPLPQDWLEFTHPEGNIYYYNTKARVVSNIDPRRNGITAIFNDALEKIQSQLRDSAPESFEVYLSVPDDPRFAIPVAGIVEYYVVDYDHRSIFWIENVDILTDLAGSASFIDQFESLRHLRSGLEPEFWMHVEYYPCHQSTYDHSAEKELTAILRHGCVDDMTAPGSVCPYGADECLRYLKLLGRFKGDDEDNHSYRRSWTARLWASICRSRHINRYGLPYPRVDRLQGLDSYLMRQTHRNIGLAIGETFCLGMSKKTFARLTELWNGRIVYQRHWQPFLEQQRSEWRWTAFGGLYLLIMNAAQSIYGASFIPVVSSASFTCSAIIISALMLHAHAADRLRTASDISSYIAMTESFNHGLRPLSIAFTLPKVLLGYGMLISAGNVVHHLAEQLWDQSSRLLYLSITGAVPLLMSLVVYLAYGPVGA